MSYDIHLSIPEDSAQGHLIASVVAEQHLTPSQVVEQIIDQAAQAQLFFDPNETPAEFVARLRARKAARGKGSRIPPSTADAASIIGLFAGNESFSQAIDEVIASRPQRYGFEE
jgi:hypothetical protein